MSAPFVNPLPPNTTLERSLITNERVTGPPGQEMIHRASNSLSFSGLTVLDNACGAGIITALLQQQAKAQGTAEGLKIIAADKADKMLDTIRTRGKESGWTNVSVSQFDQADMTLLDQSVDLAFNNFGIFFSPNDGDVLNSVHRVLKRGGTAGFTSWKSIAWWPMVQEALRANLPEAPALEDGVMSLFPAVWNDPTLAEKKIMDAGFTDVRVEEFKFAPSIEAEAFGEATAELVKMATMRMWNEDARKRYGGSIQDAITKHLRDRYEGGVWDGQMTALISIGRR